MSSGVATPTPVFTLQRFMQLVLPDHALPERLELLQKLRAQCICKLDELTRLTPDTIDAKFRV